VIDRYKRGENTNEIKLGVSQLLRIERTFRRLKNLQTPEKGN
jgi:hypothetical protein